MKKSRTAVFVKESSFPYWYPVGTPPGVSDAAHRHSKSPIIWNSLSVFVIDQYDPSMHSPKHCRNNIDLHSIVLPLTGKGKGLIATAVGSPSNSGFIAPCCWGMREITMLTRKPASTCLLIPIFSTFFTKPHARPECLFASSCKAKLARLKKFFYAS